LYFHSVIFGIRNISLGVVTMLKAERQINRDLISNTAGKATAERSH